MAKQMDKKGGFGGKSGGGPKGMSGPKTNGFSSKVGSGKKGMGKMMASAPGGSK
jgi:hypothetical protein